MDCFLGRHERLVARWRAFAEAGKSEL